MGRRFAYLDAEHVILALAIIASTAIVVFVVWTGRAGELATLLGAVGGVSGLSGLRALFKPSPSLGPDDPFSVNGQRSAANNDLGIPSSGSPVEIATTAPAAGRLPGVSDVVTPRMFAVALLEALGQPVSQNNVQAIIAAENLEGGYMHNTAHFNPLNTTRKTATSYTAFTTPAPIQGYASWEDGLAATVASIENGMYADVLACLARSAPPDETLRAIQMGPWGWYKIIGGVKVPNAIRPAAALQFEADTPFPAGGGSLGGGAGLVALALAVGALFGLSKVL